MCRSHGKHASTIGHCVMLVPSSDNSFDDKSSLSTSPDPDHGSDQVCPEWPEYGCLSLSTSVC